MQKIKWKTKTNTLQTTYWIYYINIWIYKWYKIKITCTEIIDNEKDEKTFENN